MVKRFTRTIKKESQSTGMGVGVTTTNTGNEMGGGGYTYPPYSAGRGAQPDSFNNGDIFDEKIKDHHYIDLKKLYKKIEVLIKAGETEEAERLSEIYNKRVRNIQEASDRFKLYKKANEDLSILVSKKRGLIKEMFELSHNIGSSDEENRAKLARIEDVKDEIQDVRKQIREHKESD